MNYNTEDFLQIFMLQTFAEVCKIVSLLLNAYIMFNSDWKSLNISSCSNQWEQTTRLPKDSTMQLNWRETHLMIQFVVLVVNCLDNWQVKSKKSVVNFQFTVQTCLVIKLSSIAGMLIEHNRGPDTDDLQSG